MEASKIGIRVPSSLLPLQEDPVPAPKYRVHGHATSSISATVQFACLKLSPHSGKPWQRKPRAQSRHREKDGNECLLLRLPWSVPPGGACY